MQSRQLAESLGRANAIHHVRAVLQMVAKHGMRIRTNGLCPFKEGFRFSVKHALVCDRAMFLQGDHRDGSQFQCMKCHPLTRLKNFERLFCESSIDLLPNQMVRDRVKDPPCSTW